MTPEFDHALSEDARMIRDATARFSDERIAPLAARIDAEDWFPRELWPEMGELGLHGITVEEEWGGLWPWATSNMCSRLRKSVEDQLLWAFPMVPIQTSA